MSDLFYENGKIRVTKNIFANGAGENFIISNIRHVREERKGKSLFPLVIGAILGAVAGVYKVFPYSEYILSTLGSLFVMLYFSSKDKFTLYLTTNTGEHKAFVTKKEAICAEVHRQIKRAMSASQIK